MYFADLYSAMRRAATGSVLAVAVVARSSDCPTHSSMRSWSNTSSTGSGRAADQRVRVDEREVADEDRHALAEASGFAAPLRGAVALRERAVHGVAVAAHLRTVHHVVVHERERVHELERGGGRDHVLRRPRRRRCR